MLHPREIGVGMGFKVGVWSLEAITIFLGVLNY